MAKITVKVNFDKKAAIAHITAASDKALTALGLEALKDVTQYVSKDQNALRKSGTTHSDIKAEDGKFTLRWSTPYAQYLWHGDVMYGDPTSRTYGPAKITFTEALAREEWAIYAQKIHGEQWEKIYQKVFERELS